MFCSCPPFRTYRYITIPFPCTFHAPSIHTHSTHISIDQTRQQIKKKKIEKKNSTSNLITDQVSSLSITSRGPSTTKSSTVPLLCAPPPPLYPLVPRRDFPSAFVFWGWSSLFFMDSYTDSSFTAMQIFLANGEGKGMVVLWQKKGGVWLGCFVGTGLFAGPGCVVGAGWLCGSWTGEGRIQWGKCRGKEVYGVR